jgi:hypothetical protein
MDRNGPISRQATTTPPAATAPWGYGMDSPYAFVTSAVAAAQKEGFPLHVLSTNGENMPCRWARSVAECVARGECRGGIIFCQDPGLVCCIANKVPGLRAVAVATVAQAARAALTLGANLVAVEMPGRTYFEIRHILRTLCGLDRPSCPTDAASTLQELDGHAHR